VPSSSLHFDDFYNHLTLILKTLKMYTVKMNIHFFYSVHYNVGCQGSLEIFKVITFSLHHRYHEIVSSWSSLLKLEHVINNYA